jgi:hypothetical protein
LTVEPAAFSLSDTLSRSAIADDKSGSSGFGYIKRRVAEQTYRLVQSAMLIQICHDDRFSFDVISSHAI